MKKKMYHAVCMALALAMVTTACASTSSEETTVTHETTVLEETTSEATTETTVETTATEVTETEVEETEVVEETQLEPQEIPVATSYDFYFDMPVDEAFQLFLNYISEHHKDHPDATYTMYRDCGDQAVYLMSLCNHEEDNDRILCCYSISEDKQVELYYAQDCGKPVDKMFSYDEIKSFPMMPDSAYTQDSVKSSLGIVDGSYDGELLGYSEDGSKMFIILSEVLVWDKIEDINISYDSDYNYVGTFTYDGKVYDIQKDFSYGDAYDIGYALMDNETSGRVENISHVSICLDKKIMVLPVDENCVFKCSNFHYYTETGFVNVPTSYEYVGKFQDSVFCNAFLGYEPDAYNTYESTGFIGNPVFVRDVVVEDGVIKEMSFHQAS
ncbi:MAG: hypothetical protein MJ166_07305 [Clostridia bacterium]|nr:hypothetical protein [Clostridia bacterium]